MSKRNLASPEPDQPSKRRLVQGPLATSTQYHILKGKRLSIPSELGRRILARCTLEILDVGSVDIQNTADPNRNNHCILRLTFAAPTTEATRHAPIGTRGLILDQVPDDQRDTTTTCEFHMKTFRYEGPHEDALKTIDLPIRGKQGAKGFIRVLRKANLVPCEFDSTDDFMYGCRDFMSQFIHRLNEAGVLRLSDDAATSIFSQFNIRFNDDVPDTPVPVTYAVFARKYEHLRVEGVKYRGKRRFIGEVEQQTDVETEDGNKAQEE